MPESQLGKPRLEDGEKNQELAGRHQFPRGCELSFPARLFEAPASRFFGFAGIRHRRWTYVARRARTNCIACPADCVKTLGKISSSQAEKRQRQQHLDRKRKPHDLKLRIEPGQKREGDLHHQKQRQKRQHQTQASGENGRSQSESAGRPEGGNGNMARSLGRKALGEGQEHLTVQPSGEEEQARR